MIVKVIAQKDCLFKRKQFLYGCSFWAFTDPFELFFFFKLTVK